MGSKAAGVLVTLTGAFVVVSFVFVSKYNELTTKVAGLQKKIDYLESRAERPVAPSPGPTPSASPVPAGSVSGEPSPAPAPVPAPERIPAPSSIPDFVNPAEFEKAVARAVDKTLREKYPHLAEGEGDPEDRLALLERELGLNAMQKSRIGEILKQRAADEEAFSAELAKKMQEGTLANPMDAIPKAMEIGARYDELLKKELDLGQQQKYDDLKKKGVLPGAGNVRIKMTSSTPPPK
jgi:hypothetical protein